LDFVTSFNLITVVLSQSFIKMPPYLSPQPKQKFSQRL